MHLLPTLVLLFNLAVWLNYIVLGYDALPMIDLSSSISALAKSADRPDWTSLDDIDIPVRQHAFSHCIDEVSYQLLITTAPDKPWAPGPFYLSSACWRLAQCRSFHYTLGLHLHDREFRLARLQYWMGLRLAKENSK